MLVEERAHGIRCDFHLTAAVYPEAAKKRSTPRNTAAFQQRAIVAEREVVRAADGDPQSRVVRLRLNRLNLAQDTPALGVLRSAVIGEQEHEGHTECRW